MSTVTSTHRGSITDEPTLCRSAAWCLNPVIPDAYSTCPLWDTDPHSAPTEMSDLSPFCPQINDRAKTKIKSKYIYKIVTKNHGHKWTHLFPKFHPAFLKDSGMAEIENIGGSHVVTLGNDTLMYCEWSFLWQGPLENSIYMEGLV